MNRKPQTGWEELAEDLGTLYREVKNNPMIIVSAISLLIALWLLLVVFFAITPD